ncbi:MAG: M20 metallopeptidase family protein [bacterium]
MNIIEKVRTIKDKLIEIREDFHKYPELSFQEKRTSMQIANILQNTGLDDVQTGIAETGVVGILYGKKPGKTIAFRADIDALPIQEENDVSYRSKNDGVMHACGHDAHITSVLGSAIILNDMKDTLCGNVKFIFQPAEEIFGGAEVMIKNDVLDSDPKVDAIVGMHVWPELDVGTIGIRSGAMMASADKFEIMIQSSGGHGALPHLTSDPIVSAAQIINSLQTITSRSIDPLEPIVVSVCRIEGGRAFNIIPREVRMEGTVRTLDEKVSNKTVERMKDIISGIEKAMRVECQFNYINGCPPLINHPDIVALIEKAGKIILGSDKVVEVKPAMGGEDFTYYTREVPGAMFCLGTRNEKLGFIPPVHRPTFDIDNEALVVGTSMLVQIALTFLMGEGN